jgi:hypothetical protein
MGKDLIDRCRNCGPAGEVADEPWEVVLESVEREKRDTRSPKERRKK